MTSSTDTAKHMDKMARGSDHHDWLVEWGNRRLRLRFLFKKIRMRCRGGLRSRRRGGSGAFALALGETFTDGQDRVDDDGVDALIDLQLTITKCGQY